ncbi:caspase family protein [Streptomyces sp. NPDC001581]|uniref:caspase, EACC1-associated type n=1 Tax=Streptomyces sp. NPDC001581 TaxID=3154386 RepID=UPI00333318D1
MTLPDPSASRAILIGVGQYSHLPAIPTVRQNVVALNEILTGVDSWNLPAQNCVMVHDPRTPEELVDPIYQCAQEATDTLLVYYAGHGLRGESRGELRLTRSTSRAGASHTSTDYNEIREALLSAVAMRRIVILDCCYAASALGVMSGTAHSLAEEAIIEGTYLIAAAGETQPAMADNGDGFTVFTGELVNLIRNGVPDQSKMFLDLDSIYTYLFRSLQSKARPLPHKRVRNSPGGLALSLNMQWAKRRPPSLLPAALKNEVITLNPATDGRTQGNSLSGTEVAKSSAPVGESKEAAPATSSLRPGAWPGTTTTPSITAREDVAPTPPGAWPGTTTPPATAGESKKAAPTTPSPQPGAWPEVQGAPGRLSENATPSERSGVSDKSKNVAPAPPPAKPNDWPIVRTASRQEIPRNLGEVREFWPEVLEALKEHRRFAWIVLSQNTEVVAFNGRQISLAFENKRSREVYKEAELDKALEYVIRDAFKLPWAIEAVNKESEISIAPAPRKGRPGEWPTVTAGFPNDTKRPEEGIPGGAEAVSDGGANHLSASATGGRLKESTSFAHRWPEVLEEVKKRRRFAWLILSHYAELVHFGENLLRLAFLNDSTRINYHTAGVHEILESTLRDKFNRSYEVDAFTRLPKS